jgi:hypothetical protein
MKIFLVEDSLAARGQLAAMLATILDKASEFERVRDLVARRVAVRRPAQEAR